MQYSQEELAFIMERIEKQSYELTEWELSFFNSIKSWVMARKELSSSQMKVLNKIWDKLDLR